LPQIGINPTSRALASSLDEWFAAQDRHPEDWVVFYYTGHGVLDKANTFYLLTSDSKTGSLTTTALSVHQLAGIMLDTDASGKKRRVRRVLLIIDSCHSGAASETVLLQTIRSLFNEPTDMLVSVLAATFPNGEAFAGALARALADAIEDDAVGGSQQQFLYLESDLMPAIRKRLSGQKPIYSTIATGDSPEFIPNPRFRANLPLVVEVARVRRAATESGDLIAHWSPRSRGVEFDTDVGSFFTGRSAALHDSTKWLRSSEDFRTLIVTGSPGVGKSAVLSKIVTLSDPDYRKSRRDDPWNADVSEGAVDVAIHARGKTAGDVIRRLSAELEVPADRERLYTALGARKQPLRIVIDGLDEAVEAGAIAELLEPMHVLRGVKVLVGTRPEYVRMLGEAPYKVDLNERRYSSEEDVGEYIKSRLRASGKKEYQAVGFADAVSRFAAGKAETNFLVARLLAEDLIKEPPANLDQLYKRQMATGIDQAFADYLRRYGRNQTRVRDVLRPLAWTLGAGCPWSNIWAPLATALSKGNATYTDDDIRWVLDNAGSFILETLEDKRSVYRLFHQGIADYLRREGEQ
jgi:hypothetical protein